MQRNNSAADSSKSEFCHLDNIPSPLTIMLKRPLKGEEMTVPPTGRLEARAGVLEQDGAVAALRAEVNASLRNASQTVAVAVGETVILLALPHRLC